jgi:hypothetical protein
MKNNHRRLMAVLRMIGYSGVIFASFGKYDCTVIANYSPQMISKILNCKFKVKEADSTTTLFFERGNVTILVS